MPQVDKPAGEGASPPDTREPAAPRKPHRLGPAAVTIPLRAAAGAMGGPRQAAKAGGSLPPPLAGERRDLATAVGRLATFEATPRREAPGPDATPLLLVHSINAAGSSYEVRPIWEHYRTRRPVYAFDLPGYGLSDRTDRLYTPRVMTDAILAMTDDIRARHDTGPIDVLALSLSSEFLARAAAERPDAFRSIALVSPTGFDSRGPRDGPPGSDRGMPTLYKAFSFRPWRVPLFHLLTSRVSIRYFLEKTWGSKAIDEGLLEYDVLTTHQPGAEHAPYSFIAGFLFSNDITRVYDGLRLPVWMVHGVRGDFVDYKGKVLVEGRPNWTVDVLETGALPQFEMMEAFAARYDAFLDGVG